MKDKIEKELEFAKLILPEFDLQNICIGFLLVTYGLYIAFVLNLKVAVLIALIILIVYIIAIYSTYLIKRRKLKEEFDFSLKF